MIRLAENFDIVIVHLNFQDDERDFEQASRILQTSATSSFRAGLGERISSEVTTASPTLTHDYSG